MEPGNETRDADRLTEIINWRSRRWDCCGSEILSLMLTHYFVGLTSHGGMNREIGSRVKSSIRTCPNVRVNGTLAYVHVVPSQPLAMTNPQIRTLQLHVHCHSTAYLARTRVLTDAKMRILRPLRRLGIKGVTVFEVQYTREPASASRLNETE
jgi:hypothetical protein